MNALLANRQRLASILVALGPERGAKILQGFSPEMIEELADDIAQVGTLSPEEVHSLLEELAQDLVASRLVAEGGVDYCIELLSRVLGPERAREIAARIDPIRNRPFGYLAAAPPEVVSRALADEPGPAVALALAHLEPATTASILRQMDVGQQADVAVRLANLEHAHTDVVDALDAYLRERLSPLLEQDLESFEGLNLVVEVLNQSSQDNEKALMAAISERDEELAKQIKDALFVFADITRLDDRAIQEVLKTVDTRDLAVALKGAEDEVGERIFTNLSTRARQNLQEEIEYLSGVRKSDIKDAQKSIVDVIRKLEEAGTIMISRSSDDE